MSGFAVVKKGQCSTKKFFSKKPLQLVCKDLQNGVRNFCK